MTRPNKASQLQLDLALQYPLDGMYGVCACYALVNNRQE